MADQLNQQEDDLLQAALGDAFSVASIPVVPVQLPSAGATAGASQAEPEAQAEAEAEAGAEGEVQAEGTPKSGEWRADYETHVAEWRARSAHQRQKSEAERARWAAIRAAEEREGKVPASLEASVASTSGWVQAEAEGGVSPSPADARDLVSGETSKEAKAAAGEPSSTFSSPPVTVSVNHGDSEPESSKHDKWEDIPSELTSSYPSINFPSDMHSPSSSNPHQRLPHAHGAHEHAHPHAHPHHEPPRVSATSAVFDTTLSKRTRALALVSSLAINLLLPFINGVMLGFGELFAKNVVLGWFGWKNPGAKVANVGLRRPTTPPRKKEL